MEKNIEKNAYIYVCVCVCVCVYTLNHLAVQQKLTQHCKLTMYACMLSCFSRVQLFQTL